MKKVRHIIIITLCVLIGGYSCTKQNPDTILRSVPLSLFEVDIAEISPVVTHFEERWCPNGDGYFKYEGDHPAFFKQFKQLPFKEDWRKPSGQSKYLRSIQKGYYLFHYYETDPRDHEILIIDSENCTGVLYYEYL